MGFAFPNATITIDFPADHELYGLEVTAGTVPLGVYLELSGLASDADGDGKDGMAAMVKLVDQFATVALKGWNADIPATAEGLLSLDTRHALAIITAWMRAAGGEVSAPLDQPSPGGVPSEVPLPPMEIASTSLAS